MANFISCNKDYSYEGGAVSVATANQPPIAIAFWDSLNNQPPGTKIVTAKYSSDPDGTIVSHKWTKVAGPTPGTIIDPSSFQTLITDLVHGTYAFELTVTDNGGLTAKDTVLVNVVTPTPPTTTIRANAGPDQTIALPLDSTYLDGGASAPNGFTASRSTIFRWTTLAGPRQYVLRTTPVPVAALAKTSVVANGLIPGVYLFTFTVTEPGLGSSTDTVKVTVIDDPLNRNSVTYHDLVWEESDPFGLSWLTTFLTSPLRPDIFDKAGVNRGVEVSMKLNSTTPWTIVPFRTHDPFNSDVVPYLAAILTEPNNPLLVGLKSDMRVRFP